MNPLTGQENNLSSRRDIPEDKYLSGLATLLDAGKVESILHSRLCAGECQVKSCELTYLRYKPETNCLVAYSVIYVDPETDVEVSTFVYGKCFVDDDYSFAAEKAARRSGNIEDVKRETILLPDIRSIIYPMEYDRQLEGIQTVFDSRKLVRLIYRAMPEYDVSEWRISDKRLRVDTIRYKPEKRAVFKISSKIINRESLEKLPFTTYVRAYTAEDTERVFSAMKTLYQSFDSTNVVHIPEPLMYIPQKRLLFMREAVGEPLEESIGSEKWSENMSRAGVALAGLHRFTGFPLPVRTSADRLAEADSTAGSLAIVTPNLKQYVVEIMDRLAELNDQRSHGRISFVHGDFYYGQVLISPGNGIDTILDFDRSYCGEAEADMGNFVAHLELLAIQSRLSDAQNEAKLFLNAYTEAVGNSIEPSRLKLWTAYGLFQLAVQPFRALQQGWKNNIQAILERCLQILD